MKFYKDESLNNFGFWNGAKDTVEHLTYEEMDMIEGILEELFPEGMTETELNDFFWFERDTIADWLGYVSFEAMIDWELNCERAGGA